MGLLFTTEELFNIAAQIEARGQEFYLEMADNTSDATLKTMCEELADEEERHYQLFVELYGKVSGTKDAKPQVDTETALYIDSILDIRIFSGDQIEDEKTHGAMDTSEILRAALRLEKDTLLFFQEMVRLIPPELQDAMNKLIAEERSHVVKLNGLLRDVEQAD